MKLTEVFKNTNYTYTRFSWDAVEHVENSIVLRDNKGKLTPYITCQIRQNNHTNEVYKYAYNILAAILKRLA